MLGLNGTTVTSVGISAQQPGLLDERPHALGRHDKRRSDRRPVQLVGRESEFETEQCGLQSVAFAPPASCPAAFAAGGSRCCRPPTRPASPGWPAPAQRRQPARVSFLRLSATSALIDKGTNLGLPFSGAAPDLGCFESGLQYDPSDGGAATGDSDSGPGSEAGTSAPGSGAGASSSGASSAGSSAGSASSTGTADGDGAADQPGSASGGPGSSGAAAGNEAPTGGLSGCSCHVATAAGGQGAVSLVAAALLLRRRRGRAVAKPSASKR